LQSLPWGATSFVLAESYYCPYLSKVKNKGTKEKHNKMKKKNEKNNNNRLLIIIIHPNLLMH